MQKPLNKKLQAFEVFNKIVYELNKIMFSQINLEIKRN